MSQDTSAEATAAGFAKDPTPKEAMFFFHILSSTKSKIEVDWEVVAQKGGYSNGACASVRFGQIKRRLGITDGSGTPKAATPKKSRAIGSGTNKTPSKVTKARIPKKNSTSKEVTAEFLSGLADDDEEFLKPEDSDHQNHQNHENGGDDDNNGYFEDGTAYYDPNEVETYAA